MSPDSPEVPVSVTVRFRRPDGDVMDVRVNVPESQAGPEAFYPFGDAELNRLEASGLAFMHFNFDE